MRKLIKSWLKRRKLKKLFRQQKLKLFYTSLGLGMTSGFSDGIKKFVGNRGVVDFTRKGMVFCGGKFEAFPEPVVFQPMFVFDKKTTKKMGLSTTTLWFIDFKSEIDHEVNKLVEQYRREAN